MHEAVWAGEITILTETRRAGRATIGLLEAGQSGRTRRYFYKTGAPGLALEESLTRIAIEATQGVNGISPVRSVQYLPDRDMLLLEHLDDVQDGFNWVWNQSSWIPYNRQASHLAPEEVGTRVGKWLKAFHDATTCESPDGSGGAPSIIQRALERCKRLEVCPRCSRLRPLLGETGALLTRWATKCHAWAVGPTGWIHGDLHLNNVGITPDGHITVFDFGESRMGCQLEDVIRISHELRMIAGTTAKRRRYLTRFINALLDAYGSGEFAAHRHFADLVRLDCSLLALLVVTSTYEHCRGWTTRWMMAQMKWQNTHFIRHVLETQREGVDTESSSQQLRASECPR